MLFFVLASLFGLVAVAGVVGWFVTRKQPDSGYNELKPKTAWAVVAAVGVVAVVATVVGSGLTVVGARSVGIQTAFGKYTNTLPNGLHFTAPWSNVEEFSTQVQFLNLSDKDTVPINFKGGGGGNMDVTPRWRIDPAHAEELWKKYRTFEHVRDQLVNSTSRDSVRFVASQYSPNDARAGDNLRAIETSIQKDLTDKLVNDGIIIDSLSVRAIHLDANSQASLDKIVSANNDIQRAQAEQERAKIDAETAKIRENSGSLAPDALQRYCLEVVNNWNKDKNGELPAGFNCFNNSSPFVVTK